LFKDYLKTSQKKSNFWSGNLKRKKTRKRKNTTTLKIRTVSKNSTNFFYVKK